MCGGVCWILRTPVRMAELRVAQQVSQAKLLGMQHRGKRGAHRMHEGQADQTVTSCGGAAKDWHISR
jgi:hypothetical protein